MLQDIKRLAGTSGRVIRHQVAPVEPPDPVLPLFQGTEKFSEPWLTAMHSTAAISPPFDLACYIIKDATITGDGQVWIDDHLVIDTEIMPGYVQAVLDLKNGGNTALRGAERLPVRTIYSPCLVASGHGIHVYGHFLVEMLFRILIVERLFELSRPFYKILLDKNCPSWLLRILIDDLKFNQEDLEFFDPLSERLRLSHAIVPTHISRNERFHRRANDLLSNLTDRVNFTSDFVAPARVFIKRKCFRNSASRQRICRNEFDLAALAEDRFGFKSIVPESLTWRQQVALFQQAEIILGQAGSALHTALFSRSGTRLGSIGVMNFTQSSIGALRKQHNAFFTIGATLQDEFSIDETLFEQFLNAFCA